MFVAYFLCKYFFNHMQMNTTKIALFEGKRVRKVFKDGEWWFSVIDVVEVLTNSPNPRDYWYRMKLREKTEARIQLSTFCRQLKLQAPDGKARVTDCANTENLLRIIQSIPSPKAEPFKLWLARIGYERIKEIEDPELSTKRARELYQAKGYSDEWIKRRLRGITVREELTKEWSRRGVKEGLEYSILTAEISKATFGVTPKEHKELKNLKNETLRDHMTNLELLFNMLGEDATKEIAKAKDSKGFAENKDSAVEGGSVAGKARIDLEKKTGKKVVSRKNYKDLGGERPEALN
jgi:hypothetical protein